MRAIARGFLVLATIVGFAAVARSASLLTLDVVADGSLQPPGDRIDLSVLFFPEDDRVTVETRVFAKLEDAREGQVITVKSREGAFRDAEGRWLSRVTLDRPLKTTTAETSVVIPFASLDLPVGKHELAYEIRVLRTGQPDLIQATPMTPIVVSARTRTKYLHREEGFRERRVKERRSAQFLEKGELVAREIDLEEEEPVSFQKTRLMKVEIPGEYLRPQPARFRKALPPADQDSTRLSERPPEGQPWASLSRFEPKAKRTLYFATNRVDNAPHATTLDRFGQEAGPRLTYGTCLVNIPVRHHRRGELELPSSWWDSRDPSRFFLVEAMSVLPRDLFVQSLSANDVLLFIHGYNTTLEADVLQTAQLVHDLEFPGVGVAFGWPSSGTLAGYGHDEEQNSKSVPALVELLKQLSAPSSRGGPARRVHVIAHSMGNRLFLQAARQFELEQGTGSRKIFGHVALAAPDVDAATFGALIPSVLRQSETTTLYYCQYDRALLASRTVHMDKPVGLEPFFAEGLDTINADRANTSILGHGYFASAHPLLIDLKLTILFNQKPAHRLPPLAEPTRIFGFLHWSLIALRPPG